MAAITLGTILAVIAAGTAVAGTTHGVVTNFTKADNRAAADEAYRTYSKNLKTQGVYDLDTKDAIDYLRAHGYITIEEYDAAVKEYKKFEKQYKDAGPDYLYVASTSSKKFDNLTKIYEKLNEHSAIFARAAKMTADEMHGAIKEGFQNSLKNIHDVNAPSYLDTTFLNESKEAKPMRLMTGQEMADLHGLDYDPDTYYNLIKQGTEADVKYTDYLSRQMNEASMYDDTKTVNSYLDSIRNNKAEALASGATAGARAAQEVLANQAAITSYADKQNDVASQRYDTVSQALMEDAQAKLTARDYFNSLAQSLATDALTLYATDAERYAGEQAMYADIFDANEYLRQERIRANGTMAGAYASNQAAINAAKAGVLDKQNEYDWIYDRVLGAYGGDARKANIEFNKMVRKEALGYTSYVDNYLNNN